jgi:Holliday junction resolvasome RuvABC endonuclease subunit
MPVAEYSAREVKKSVVGHGAASKTGAIYGKTLAQSNW